jgi:hypothetical protein
VLEAAHTSVVRAELCQLQQDQASEDWKVMEVALKWRLAAALLALAARLRLWEAPVSLRLLVVCPS